MQKIRKKCHRLAYRCNCMSTVDVAVPPPPPPPVCRAPSSSRSRPQSSKGLPNVSDDDTDESNENDEDFIPTLVTTLLEVWLSSIYVEHWNWHYVYPFQDVIGSSQLAGAPQSTQQSLVRARKTRRDKGLSSANVLSTAPGRQRRKTKQYTPGQW